MYNNKNSVNENSTSSTHSSEVLSEILMHHGENPDDYFGAIVPPIAQTSNFRFRKLSDLRKVLADESQRPIYTRGSNPTVSILRKKLASLEKTEDALVFASGSAAVSAAILSNVQAGDHVVCVKKPYGWTQKLLERTLPQFSIKTTFVDGSDPLAFLEAITSSTKIIYLESPNSWTFEIQDLKAVTQIAKEKGILTLIDNSCATPLSQNPADYGIDIIIHSASKYIGGHSDVVAGVICAKQDMIRKIFYGPFMTLGGIISPHDAWLILRGLRTLEIRYHRSCDSAEKVVAFLESHPAIEKVLYTHSPHFSQHALAVQQQRRGGGLFSINLKTQKLEIVEKFCESLKYFQMAVSWGGYESLFFPACVFHRSDGSSPGVLPMNMIRFYVGLECPTLLIKDLDCALKNSWELGHS